MSFLGIYVFVGIDSEAAGMTECEFSYYEDYNLPDLWLSGSDFILDDLNKVVDDNDILSAERRIVEEGKAITKSDKYGDDPNMTFIFIEEGQLSKMYIAEGENYVKGKSGVWLDYYFAKNRGLAVGDVIRLKINSKEFSEKINGLFYHPEYIYFLEDVAAIMPNYGQYGVAILDADEYPMEEKAFNQIIADAKDIDNRGGVSLEEKNVQQKLSSSLKTILDNDNLIVTFKDDQLSYQTYRSEMSQHKSMAVVFPIVFVLIAMLGIVTTMSRIMSRQRVQIGTMKALGFSTAMVIRHYISYGFVLSLLGSVSGALLGYYTLPDFIISMFTGTYIIPNMHKGFSSLSFVIIIMQVMVSTLITYYSCKKQCSLIPAQALRTQSPKIQRASIIENTPLWNKLSFSTQWNLRDILRNKVRTIMGMLGVVGCAMLMLGSFGCLDSIKFITGWMYGEINTSTNKIVMEENVPFEITEEYAKEYKGQMVQNTAITLISDTSTKTGTITVLDDGNFLHFQDRDRNHISFNKKGVAMSYKMAESLNIKEGDYFSWHIIGDDDIKRSRVSQIYRNPSTQGITVYRDFFEKLDYRFAPNEIYTNMNIPDDLKSDDEIAGTQRTREMMESLDAMMVMMYTMAGILIAAAIILAVVVLYNLGVLSLVEKRKEMATLKVMGFQTQTVRNILQQQNIWVTIAGIIIGYPAGRGLLYVLFADMPENMDYIVVVYPLSYILTFIGTFVLSVLVNRILSREVKNIDMVEALKGQE